MVNMVTAFSQKAHNFVFLESFCSNFTWLWYKYLLVLRNYKLHFHDFRLPITTTLTRKNLNVICTVKYWYSDIENRRMHAEISLDMYFTTGKQIWTLSEMIRTTQTFEFFDKAFAPFYISEAKNNLFDAKLLIGRLQAFSVHVLLWAREDRWKIAVVRHLQSG